MPNNVELVKLRILLVREGVELPSVLVANGCRNCDEKVWGSAGGVGGAEGGAEERSKVRRSRGRGDGFMMGPSLSSCMYGWLMAKQERVVAAERQLFGEGLCLLA